VEDVMLEVDELLELDEVELELVLVVEDFV
jgi:hypothetical protein